MNMPLSDDAWKTYSFDSSKTVQYLGELVQILTGMGIDITNKDQLKEGFGRLFHIEYINIPDMDNHSCILAPNHVSDFDALILGLVHDNIKIMAKSDWAENEKLMEFLKFGYDLIGVNRESRVSQARALVGLIKHLNCQEPRHALIFPQGTISDVNKNSVERVQPGIFVLSGKSTTPIVPVFVEQPNFNFPTRIVFGDPMDIPGPKEDCRALWIEKIISLQNSLTPPARMPVLTQKHANNNKPGDLFF